MGKNLGNDLGDNLMSEEEIEDKKQFRRMRQEVMKRGEEKRMEV